MSRRCSFCTTSPSFSSRRFFSGISCSACASAGTARHLCGKGSVSRQRCPTRREGVSGCTPYPSGEVGVAALLIPALLKKKPDLKIVLSTVTQTGRAEAEKISGVEQRIYLPLDFSWAVRSALRRIQPSMIALIETEIWPNLVGAAARRNIPVAIVNGRLSEALASRLQAIPVFLLLRSGARPERAGARSGGRRAVSGFGGGFRASSRKHEV